MKKIVILGGGISGYGTALLAKKLGFEVFLSDMGQLKAQYIKLLEEHGVEYEQGQHTQERILSADEIVKSPGIPDKAPMVRAAREQGIPIISEIEFAGRYADGARTIIISGSNGKTTTTSIIYKILSEAGYRVALGGNIGESFAASVAEGGYDWYVLEISSFQLDGMYEYRADVSVLMNITPDHLDRYEYKFQNYIDSKMRITQNQTSSDRFIFMADDEAIRAELSKRKIEAQLLPFSAKLSEEMAASIEGEQIVARMGEMELSMPLSDLKIKGLHNSYNVMAAMLAALAAEVPAEQILASIGSFDPVEHRLEPAGEIDGVKYINDSKATNVDSVWYALESLQSPGVWIAGGTDKGNDYEPLKAFAREKIHTLVCMGLDNGALEAAFEGVVPNIISTASLEEAMAAARSAARSGDVVLLSPACASFDLFTSYINRGELFKEWVTRHKS